MKVAPDKESPAGHLCPRGAIAPRILYGEERILYPMIRDGARGEGKLRRATWDEALDRAAALVRKAMEAHGPQTMASYYGRGVLSLPITRYGMGSDTMLGRLGSPNDMNCASICNMSSSTATPFTVLGLGTRQMVQDVENCDYIVSWGKNSTTDDGPQMMLRRIKAAQERGAKLIVVDPRKTGLGEIADWWIPVTPGADGALALGMLKVIIEEGLYDHDFVENYTTGFEQFSAYLAGLTLEQLSAWCGVPVADIERFARLFAKTRRATLVSYTGLEYQLSAVQNNRAILILWAITGKLDVEGSIYLNASAEPTFAPTPLPDDSAGPLPIGAREFPLFYGFLAQGQFARFPHAVLADDPYPTRGLLVVGGSPASSFPDSASWHAAYERLECMVVVDRFFTEECRFADVVFPACTLYESHREIATTDGPGVAEPFLAPAGEAREDVLILGDLARRLGVGEGYPEKAEDIAPWFLSGKTPYTGDFTIHAEKPAARYRKYETGGLRADGTPGFPTPSGKLEICSSILAEYGFTPYPEYHDIRELSGMDDPAFPLTLTTGARHNLRIGAFGANLPEIARAEPKPRCDISPEDAEALGIADGDDVVVTTPFGSAPFQARVFGMAKGSLHVPHGGGSAYMPEAWRQGNANSLTSLDYCDPVTGFVAFKSVPCRIEKAA